MPKRHKLLAANWKMNPPPKGFDMPIGPYRSPADVDIVVFPTFADIDRCVAAGLTVGGQYGRPEESGAFTGDLSMTMLAAHGCKAVLCGHSERRRYHGETDELIGKQVRAAVEAGLLPILCVGETEEERNVGNAPEVVRRQLGAALGLEAPIVIAYEPVWAIGTGKTPTPDEIQAMHVAIRSWLPGEFGDVVPLIYGGSVKPENAAAIFACPDVDGALPGGASLDPVSFGEILDHLRAANA